MLKKIIQYVYFSLTMIWHCAPTILMHTKHKSHLNNLFKKEVVSSYRRESEIFARLISDAKNNH